jgi:hypothetical protein
VTNKNVFEEGWKAMFCAKCGAQVDEGSSFCQKCGTAVDQPAVAQPAAAQPQAVASPPMPVQAASAEKTSGMAITSLVLGIISLIINPVFILSILAIIFGIVGIGQINKSGGTIKGKGFAVAGIIIGGLAVILMIIVLALVGFSLTLF